MPITFMQDTLQTCPAHTDMPSTRDEQLPSEATAKKTCLIETDTLKATAVAKLPTASHQRHVNTTIALDINTALRADLHCFVLRLKAAEAGHCQVVETTTANTKLKTCLSPPCRLFLGFAAAGTSTCHAALACRRRQQTAVERSALAQRPQQISSDCIESLPVPGREGGPKSFQPPTFLKHGEAFFSPLCRLFLGFAAAGTSPCHAAVAGRRSSKQPQKGVL